MGPLSVPASPLEPAAWKCHTLRVSKTLAGSDCLANCDPRAQHRVFSNSYKCFSSAPLTVGSVFPQAGLIAVMTESAHKPPPRGVLAGKDEPKSACSSAVLSRGLGPHGPACAPLFPAQGYPSPDSELVPTLAGSTEGLRVFTLYQASSGSRADLTEQNQQRRGAAGGPA